MTGWSPKCKRVRLELTRPQLRQLVQMAREKAERTANLTDRRTLATLAKAGTDALQRARAENGKSFPGYGATGTAMLGEVKPDAD